MLSFRKMAEFALNKEHSWKIQTPREVFLYATKEPKLYVFYNKNYIKSKFRGKLSLQCFGIFEVVFLQSILKNLSIL